MLPFVRLAESSSVAVVVVDDSGSGNPLSISELPVRAARTRDRSRYLRVDQACHSGHTAPAAMSRFPNGAITRI